MALPAVGSAFYPSPDEVLAIILSDLRYLYARRGLTRNLLEGSDEWYRAKVVADRVSIAIANGKIGLENLSPLRATGQALLDWCEVFGVKERAASSAAGFVYVFGTSGVTPSIPADFRATAPNGAKYKTLTINSVALSGTTKNDNTPSIQIQAIKTGASTNQDPGTKLTWDDASIGALFATCTVGPSGIKGGAEKDTEEVLRRRLLRKLSSPGVGGNWSHVAEWAEEASSAVEFALVYPGVQGAGSYGLALTAAGGDRSVSQVVIDLVDAYVEGKHPGHASVNTTGTSAQELDVVINADLSLPENAGGSGGGYKDSTPWPADDASLAGATVPVSIVTVTAASRTLEVNTTVPPVAGNHFALWDPDEQTMTEFTAESVSASGGGHEIVTVEAIPSWVVTGMYPSAAAENLDAYAAAFAEAMAELGPGEKTASLDLLPRSARHPKTDASNPAALSEAQLAGIIQDHTEIVGMNYAARYETGTTTTRTAPAVPATTADPPKILVLKNLAFRRST